MTINKQKIQTIMILLVICAMLLLLSSFNTPTTAFANSAEPIRPDGDSGIVFKQHEHIQIQREVLDIQINDDATANIRAAYVMKNTSAETLNVETMFLSPVEYGENKNISVQKNGADLDFTQEFFGLYSYGSNDTAQSIADWESVLNGIKSRSKPFGDAAGFWEYRIKSAGVNETYARFLPESYYFRESQAFNTLNQNKVELRNYKSYDNSVSDIIIVSKQDFIPETNGNLIKTGIDDIYDYLFEKAAEKAYEEQLRFAEQQYNLYLFNFDAERLDQNFFNLIYINQYVGAITYFVDFAPSEEIELTVSYVYQMGTSGYHTADLLYYLSPAKYWKDFADIEINLSLSEKFKELKSSSLTFSKVDNKNYKFISASLPDTELKLTVSDGVIFTEDVIIMIIIIAIAGIFLLAPIAVVVIVILAVKRKKRRHSRN